MKRKIDYSLPFDSEDVSTSRYMLPVCQSQSTTLSTPGLVYLHYRVSEL